MSETKLYVPKIGERVRVTIPFLPCAGANDSFRADRRVAAC